MGLAPTPGVTLVMPAESMAYQRPALVATTNQYTSLYLYPAETNIGVPVMALKMYSSPKTELIPRTLVSTL